ncbi:MAG TPA: lytic transglycosylase domain-containing protein, partial [Rhodanobacteraceae bacterium]|nr:lytic transglycosylase domain-containing protein [Rhodanobacteraceae bacterium]
MTGQASGAWRGLSLLAVLVLLAGCATPEVRPAANTHAVTLPAPAASAAAPEVALEPPPAPDFWSQLRAGFAFARCVDDPLVTPWLRRYSAHPDRLEASLSRALPRLRYIAEVLHGAGIPGEFALLPWVESSFRVLPARGDGPAGLWQIMPRTGRDLGLRIDHRYDGRLDLEQSTLAAAALLQRYDDAFGDWRLADLAYNTGMYRVKKLLAGLDAPLRADAVVP